MVGGILIKARSLMVHDDPASQRGDLLRLLSLVDQPRELSAGLRDSERRWLRQAEARLELQAPSRLIPDLQCRAELGTAFWSAARPGPAAGQRHSIGGHRL